jgi:hypothetical protein
MAVPLFFFTGIVAALRMGLLASVVAMIALGCATYSVRMQVGWEADAVYRQGEMIGAWLPQSGLAAPIQDLIREEVAARTADTIRWYPGSQIDNLIIDVLMAALGWLITAFFQYHFH